MNPLWKDALLRLPLRPRGEWIRITDSHDVTGFNNDGFLSTYSYLYRTDEGLVLFEHEGAGCIREIRTIGYTGRLRVYRDGRAEPDIDVAFDDLYAGRDPRFPADLVRDEVRGHGSAWCYGPIPFRTGIRVVATDRVASYHFYNIFAHVHSEDHGEPDAAALVPNPDSDRRIGGQVDLEPHGKATLLEHAGPGLVRELSLSIPSAIRSAALERVHLRIRWDPAATESTSAPMGLAFDPFEAPAVDAPLGLFFAAGYGGGPPDPDTDSYVIGNMQTHMRIPLGRIETDTPAVSERNGVFTCRFPMPFWRSAVVELVNHAGIPLPGIGYALSLSDNPYPPDSGRFYAFYRRENGTLPDRDYLLLETRGRGRYAGCAMRMSSRALFRPDADILPRLYLEGDARFYLDDARACLYGSTGTEEYFNWGWYDVEEKDQVFVFPTHGYPEHLRDQEDHSVMYRFHLTDSIPYYRAFRFALEHGPEGRTPSDYESVTFSYHRDEPVLALTDSLDVGSAEDEAAHGLAAGRILWSGSRTRVYEGNDQVLASVLPASGAGDWLPLAGFRDDGCAWAGTCAFSVAVRPDNAGVRIRRRWDGDYPEEASLPGGERTRVVPGQRVRVFVDDEPAGDWCLSAHHARSCWMEDEFEIPARLARGKERLRIRLETLPEGGEVGWNAFHYWVFSYIEPSA